ncbi:MAG: serine/threonine protein kinase [Polyangiaceae bacterium]|jgi:serine/threonine-protein kinase|nr:serine/threonine protein kinase [Polyangiaceae bacterium]
MFPQIFGKYVLERELASGGMARVYLATLRGAVGFEKRLVVKQIRPELALDEAFVRRFVEEAKIAVELSHPNIVPVYELGVEQGVYYIAMELCEGLTLTEVLMDTGPLDAAEGAYLGIEICRALDYAHRRGNIVHRDVTPRNVLLDEEGAVRLIDFGIAAPVTAGDDARRVEVFGSPGHMPLEQIRGERLTPATDVFAVGALLIEAWTGRPPFRRHSFEASADALHEAPPSLSAEHPELEPIAELLARTVALRPEDRPADAESLARKLRDFSRQFDSGDVGRRLGARVQRVRLRSRSSAPWAPSEASGPLTPAASPRALFSSRPPPHTPVTPVMHGQTPPAPNTRTFAARDDLVEWTRKLASVPPTAGSDGPPEPNAPKSPLPAVVDTPEPATRALPRSFAPAARRPLPWLIAGGSAAALLAVVLASQREAKPLRAVPVAAAPAPSAEAPSPALSLSVVAAVAAPPSPSSTTAPKGVGKAAQSASSASAQLRLTADPPAVVTIVGGKVSQTLSTPVRGLSLPPGAYAVTFRSPTFGEPVAARVELSASASRSVHADFRAAIPTVQVR